MTVSSALNRVRHAGNGSTVAFAVPFKFMANADLKVYLRDDTAETDQLQTLTTHYSVSGAGSDAGGTVTFVTAPASGKTIVILGDPALTQLVDYTTGDPFPAQTHENAVDLLTNQQKRTREIADRAPSLVEGDVDGSGRYDFNSNRGTNAADPEDDQDLATKTWVEAQILAGALADYTGSVSAYGATLLDDADVAAIRETLGINIAENAVYNGDFTHWLRGTSFSLTSGVGQWNADRVFNGPGVGADATVSRQAFTIGTKPSGVIGQPKYFHRTLWSVAPTDGANRTGYPDYTTHYEHRVEDVRRWAGETVTLSVWVKVNEAHGFYLYVDQGLGSGGNNNSSGNTISGTGAGTDKDSVAAEVFHRSAIINVTTTGTWQRISATFALDDLNGVTVAAGHAIIVGYGHDYDDVSNTLQIDTWGWQLVRGSTPLPFHPHDPGLQDSELRRHYHVHGPDLTGVVISSTSIEVGTTHGHRAEKTITLTLLDTTPTFRVGNDNQTGTSSSITGSSLDLQNVQVTIDGFTGLTIGEGVVGITTAILACSNEGGPG